MRTTIFLILLFGTTLVRAQSGLPACEERPTWVDPPWVDGRDWCLERVIDDKSAGELGYTALAVSDDGILYAARPLTGEILALRDTDGDGLPDTPSVVAEGITLPNGLTYYDGALYISGGSHVYRMTGTKVETLVDDLPWGAGFWTGGLAIGADERIYVAIGAPCDFCEPDDPTRGAIWRYELDGSDGQPIASGLRQPSDVAFRDGVLWTLDTARDGLTGGNLDEINRVDSGAHFGWPYCIGQDNQPDMAGDFECSLASAPAFTLPTHSNPIGLAVYNHDTFPKIQNNLLVVLRGNDHQSFLEGYALAAVQFGEDGQPSGYRLIIPERTASPTDSVRLQLDLQEIQYSGSGFWPHHPIDAAVSPEGWIYISVGGGRIYALRPL